MKAFKPVEVLPLSFGLKILSDGSLNLGESSWEQLLVESKEKINLVVITDRMAAIASGDDEVQAALRIIRQ